MTTDPDRDPDLAMAQALIERLGGALTVEDVLLLRAARIWYRTLFEISVAADFGDDSDSLSAEKQEALDIVSMLPEELDGLIAMDSDEVRGQLNRAEVATGYLFAKYGIPAEGRPPSYPSTDYEPPLGRMDTMELWDRIASADPTLKLTDAEQAWMDASGHGNSESGSPDSSSDISDSSAGASSTHSVSTSPPEFQFASNVDGDRQAIVEAAEFDMTGWALEIRTGTQTNVSRFHKIELPKGTDGRFSFIFGGDWVPVWLADASWGADDMTLIDPQGKRHELYGYIAS